MTKKKSITLTSAAAVLAATEIPFTPVNGDAPEIPGSRSARWSLDNNGEYHREDLGAINQQIPDRVCVSTSSRWHWPLYKKLGVRFNGEERKGDVEEFCVSEGWIRVRVRGDAGKFLIDNTAGTWVTEKIEGVVEPFFKVPPAAVSKIFSDVSSIARAQEKRERKAEKLRAQHADD